MSFLKLILSLITTILVVWTLGIAHQTGEPEKIKKDEAGRLITVAATEQFIPPIGKLLSPSHGFWQNAEGEIPNFETTIYHENLSAPVQVKYDDRMVPHVFAENVEDATFAQGYVTGL